MRAYCCRPVAGTGGRLTRYARHKFLRATHGPFKPSLMSTVNDRLALAHVRIAVVDRRHERLLDRPRVDPANEVEDRARLVVGPAGPRSAERLLSDDGAG